MAEGDHARFTGLTFEEFRRMAADDTLTANERIGFPDEYRAEHDEAILADIEGKLPALAARDRVVIDIGPGCAGLSMRTRELCAQRGHELVFVDSAEMLAHHPDHPALTKIAARFPDEFPDGYAGRADAVLVYSVIQYAFVDASIFTFLDAALDLLAPGGHLLVGDLPNASMRRRFLASASGRAHHRAYSGRDEDPEVRFNVIDHGEIDDAVAIALLARARAGGFHAWLVPQASALPMANRREDLLVQRP
jgi:hypothetical protein